jgi:hypothetical protein
MRFSVAIAQWHPGKLILLWAWGITLILLALLGVQAMPSQTLAGVLVGFALLAFAIAVPVILSVITWVWLGGREGKGQH